MTGSMPGLGWAGFPGPNSPAPTGSSKPNLLLFPEAFDNAVWVKSATVVTPNIGDPTYPTADQFVMSGSGSGVVTQTSSTASTTGASVSATLLMTSAWQTFSKTGTFDGLQHTLTAEVREPSGAGNEAGIIIVRSGGFLQASIFDAGGGDPTFYVHFMKLEQSGSFSGYP